ncbi:hypothetical protein IWW55_005253, partial [Coemansia sp. RSA 2706]
GSLSTRLPISLTPAIVIAITRNVSQIMATVRALSKLPQSTVASGQPGTNVPDSGDTQATPRSPRSTLQIPLPVVDILVSSFGGLGAKKSVGRCPPADVLFERLRDYSFLGCLHFMADIMQQIKPIIDIAGRSDMPVRAFGRLAEPASHTLDQRLRAYVGTVRDAIESVTLMYGEDEDAAHDRHSTNNNNNNNTNDAEDEYAGFHLNEFMHLTDTGARECSFRTFHVANYSADDSQARLIDLIRTASSAILRDLNQRFNASDIATIQALADMWDPTQLPRSPDAAARFGSREVQTLAQQLSRTRSAATGLNLLGVSIGSQPAGSQPVGPPPVGPQPSQSPLSNTPLIDSALVADEWHAFKRDVCQALDAASSAPGQPLDASSSSSPNQPHYAPGDVQVAYRERLFPCGRLAPSQRRLRSVDASSSISTNSGGTSTNGNGWERFENLSKLATAWNVLPLALSADLYLFRRLYERQLARICREQAENKLQSINFDMGDTFSELLSRLSPAHSKNKKVTVYDLLQNSKFEVETEIGSFEQPVEIGLSGVTSDYFLRSIDAVTMALDHRLRLLSIGYTESPLAVANAPGECPRWMHNAMRGYWKLACRPPRSFGASLGARHRGHASGPGSGSTQPVPPLSAPSTAPSHTLDLHGAPEPVSLHELSSATHATSVSNQSSQFLSPAPPPPPAQAQASLAQTIGTLPLLEALLSDSAANAQPALKRSYGEHAANQLAAPPEMASKRQRQSDGALATYGAA